jgi:oligopeptide/dipeptide ABC transporter ATP-binding protein
MALLEINDLRTHFFTRNGVVKSVDGISFSIEKGEILGIVGESGAGKSITGFSILKLIDEPGKIVGGEILFDGVDLVQQDEKHMQRIRGNTISMIFQDPQTSLNPVITIGEQMMEAILYHHENVNRKDAFATCVEILKKVGLPAAHERMKSYPHQLSGGMKQRVVIAMALLNNPKLLIADEPTTALDVTIQAQILYLMKKLSQDFHSSLILITHDIAVVSQLCDKIAVMYAGRIVEYGTKEEIIFDPRHPYTRGLIACLPKLNDDKDRLYQIPGIMPSLLNLPQGCYFKDRCELADSECDVYPPEQRIGSRRVFCHKVK